MKKRIFSILLSIGLVLTLLPGTILAAEDQTKKDVYNITTVADPEEGGTVTSDHMTSLSGETVNFTATPADGYQFHHWEVEDDSGVTFPGKGASFSYTMPASDVKAKAVFAPVQINLCTRRSDGGVLKLETTDGFNTDARMTNMAVDSGSQVAMVAEPDEGYEFDGYYEGIRQMDDSTKEDYGFVTDYDPDKLISDDESYTFTVTEDTNVYALFRKEETLPTLTLHWSSIDGVDLAEPIVIKNIEKGTQVYEALDTIDLNMMSHPFEKDGYIASDYKVKKPITDYADRDAMENDGVDAFAPIESNMDIYCIMMKEIDAAEITIAPPVCGTETATPDKDHSWGSQTNPPSISVPDGAGYKPLIMYEGASPAIWVNPDPNYEPFEGTIEGEESYTAQILLDTDFGYIFPNDVGITVNGGSLIEYQRTPGSLGIIASVTAIHNWGEWIVDKEATEKEEGLRHRICSGCGEKEEAVIPKTEKKSDVVPGGDSDKKGTTPSNGGDTAKKNTTPGVQTGDNANPVLYMGLGIAALLIIAVTLILLKRRERQEQ